MAVNQITPFFGKIALDKISAEDVNKWLLGFSDRGIKDKKTGEIIGSYENSYANAVSKRLSVYIGGIKK